MADQLSEGQQKENALRDAGFGDQDITQWKSQTAQDLQGAGYSPQEVNDYFGHKEPDMAPMKQLFQANLDKYQQEAAAKPQDPAAPPPTHSQGFLDAISAGWQMSSTDMLYKAMQGKSVKPDTVLSEDAPTFYRIASQATSLAGDLPAMIAGAVAGGAGTGALGAAVGSAAPGAGTIIGGAAGLTVGAGVGANALPAAIRSTLMNYYEKGTIKNFQDFWERSSSTFLDTLKAGAIGGATAGAGGKIAGLLGEAAIPTAAKIASRGAAEVATMVTLGKAMEGQVPSAQDFVDGALLVGALHGAAHFAGEAPRIASKLRDIYSNTGAQPHEVLEESLQNPIVRQDLLSDNIQVPKQFEAPSQGPMSLSAEVGKTEAEKGAPQEPGKPGEPPAPPTPNEIIRSQIGEPGKEAKEPYTLQRAYTDVVDKFDPIKQAVKALTDDPESVPVKDDAYKQFRMVADSQGKARAMLENGMFDFNTLKETGPGLKQILEPLGKDLPQFEEYAFAKRALEVEGRGIKSGFDMDAAKAVVEKDAARFQKPLEQLVDFRNGLLKYVKDSGRISDSEYNAMVEAGKSYVPLRRINEEAQSGGGGRSSPFKKLLGSDKKVQSLFQSTLEDVPALTALAEKNRALDSFVRLNESAGDKSLIEKVPTSMRPVDVQPGEVTRALKEQGIDTPAEGFSIFRGQSKSLADNEFEVYRNGKREVYKTDVPGLADSVKALGSNTPATNVLFKLASGLTHVKKLAMALTPEFAIRHFLRTQIISSIYTEGKVSPMDPINAIGELMSKDKSQAYYDWLKSGGSNSNFLEMDNRYFKDNVYDLNKETGNWMDKVWNVVKTGAESMHVLGQLAENASRLAEFKRVAGENPDAESLMKGGFASREATVDFSRMGAKMSAFNALTAFQNLTIQSVDRMGRALKEDPAGVSTRALALITVPTVLLWYANHNDPRYQETPDWEKHLFWHIITDKWTPVTDPKQMTGLPPYMVRQTKDGSFEVNNGHVFRIPKPPEIGMLFGTLPELTLNKFFDKDPRAFNEFGKSMTDMITPSFIPDLALPALEQMSNHNFFMDRPIVSASNEKLMPQYQYTDYTSETAKALGKMISAVPFIGNVGPKEDKISSPMVIDNYIHSWGGSLGQYALQVADQALIKSGAVKDPNKPSPTLADIPFIKAFVERNPSASAQSIQDFYERNNKLSQKVATLNMLGKSMNFEERQKLSDSEGLMQPLTGLNQALSTQQQMIHSITSNPNISPKDKRQLIDGAYYQMIQAARQGNQILDQAEKILGKH